MKKPGDSEPSWLDNLSSERANNIVQTLAILAAGLWAIYTFVYQAEIAPSMEPPTLSVASTLEKAGRKGNLAAIRSTITRTNVGHTSVRLLGITYNVIGVKEHFGNSNETNSEFADIPPAASTVRIARYYGKPERGEVILRGGSLFQGATTLPTSSAELNPGESVSRDIIFYVDEALFDSVRFKVRLVYQKTEDSPIPLVFEIDEEGLLVADAICNRKPEQCRGLNGTDFTTELSLW